MLTQKKMRGKELISPLSEDQILSKFCEADYDSWLGKNHQVDGFLFTFMYTGPEFSPDNGMKIKIN